MSDERCIPPWRKSRMTTHRRVTGASGPAAAIPPSQSVPGSLIDYASAVLACPSGMVITDPCRAGNPIVFVNPAFTDLTGYSSTEAIGRNCRFLQGPSSDRTVISELREALARGRPIRREILNYRKDGTQFWTDLAISPTFDRSGGLVGFVGVLNDLTERKHTEATRREAEERLSSIVQNMPGFVFRRIRRHDGRIEFPYFSPYFARMVSHREGAVPTGSDLWNHYLHPDDIESTHRGVERSAKDLSPLSLEFRMVADSEERWFRTFSVPQRQANGDVVWDGVGIDVTVEKATEIRLAYLAHHDPLTGMANRTVLAERLAEAIEARRERRRHVALSYVHLVDFSEISETLGTNDSDAALKSIAARLSEFAIQEPVTTLPVRLGGAEFAILRRGKSVGKDAEEFVASMMRSLAQPLLVGREALVIEACVGTVVLTPDDLTDLSADGAAAELMKRAAIALSAASRTGPGTHRLYDEDLDHRTRYRMMLRHSLRGAIDQDQFELHYQPLVDLQSSRIVSAEALIRWQHPELGLLRPDLFISLAEETGLIGPLGEWVMRTAMRQLNAWESEGHAPPRIALNISSVQVKMPDFVEGVRRTLAETGADARRFDLELTEGILLECSPETLSALAELKSLGFELAIDDFGAGHSSLQYLRNFQIDKIKIDRIFVRQLVEDSSDAAIIHAITSLAHSLKLGLVAEGIETAEQRDILREQGCTIGQGYFFSLPLAAEDFAWMMEHESVLPISPANKQKAGARKARRPR